MTTTSTDSDSPTNTNGDTDSTGTTLQGFLLILCVMLLITGWIVNANSGPGWIFLALATLPVGIPTAWETMRSLLAGKVDVDFLMLVGAIGACILGHFHEAAILLFLFVLSSVLETYSMGRTRRALKSLMALRPDSARIRREGEIVEVPIDEIALGEILVVRPGERIALDGIITDGEADVDESALTGEALPRWKRVDSVVLAGSINLSGSLSIRTTSTAGKSTLARLIALVESARASKAPMQRLLDGFVKFYVVVVIGTAILTAIVPPLLHWQSWQDMFYRAMTLLVVASPCALVISTPATILSAIASAARMGILFKGGLAVEALGQANVIAFDKTGTLTDGQLSVMGIETYDDRDEDTLLALAAAAESASEHPLARAIVREADTRGINVPTPKRFRTNAGLGVEAVVDEHTVILGSSRFLRNHLDEAPQETESHGHKRIHIAVDGQLAGAVLLADQLRPEAATSVERLRKLGMVKILMLTGDEETTARVMAAEAGIADYHAGLLPAEKVMAIRNLAKQGHGTIMVGDGINDAPALAAADVGVAMGASGTDLAIESADVVLMSGDLHKLVDAVSLSRRALRILRQNLLFASVVIVVLVTLALSGFLPMSIGVVGHEGSTLLVVLNGLRLLRYVPKE